MLDRPEAVERMPVVTEKHVELHCRLPLRGLVIPLAYNLLLVLLCAGHGFLTRYEGPFTRTVNVTILTSHDVKNVKGATHNNDDFDAMCNSTTPNSV